MASLAQLETVISAVKEAYLGVKGSVTWFTFGAYSLTLGLTWLTYVWLIRPFLSPLRQIPGLPFNPIYGSLKVILAGESMEASLRMIKEYGKIVRYYFFLGSERLLIADADMLKHILVTNSRNYIKPPTRLVLMKKVLGNGLVMSEGPTHAAHKRLMSPAFNQAAIRKMVTTFVLYAEKLSDIWEETIGNRPRAEDWAVLHIHADLTRMTLDVIGKTAFGHEFNSLRDPEHELTVAFQRLLSGSELTWKMVIPFYYSCNFFPEVRRFNRDVGLMKSTIRSIINQKRKRQQQGKGDQAEDVLDMMMMARDEMTGEGMTDGELEDEVMTLMAAGHETTSVGMSWALLALAQHQDIQHQAREEINRIVPADCTTIEDSHLDQMEYLGYVIRETLRLFPPVTMTLRMPIEDDMLGKYFIPKGTVILLSTGCMMRLADYYEDPLTFNPDRFATDEGKNLYTFLPFLIGNRMCLGYKFALVEMKAVLATLLRKFQFDVIPNMTYKRKQLITMRPEPFLKLRVSLVNQPEDL